MRAPFRRWLAELATSKLWQTLGVAAATLLVHGLIVACCGVPARFGKYRLGAELVLRGELGGERLADFSPFYLSLWTAVDRLFEHPAPWISWLQRLLAAGAVALLFALLRRRFKLGWALGGAAVFALDRHLLVYQHVFEPEIWLLVFLLGFLFFLERSALFDALTAGVFAALCLATRPNFLPVFALVPVALFLRTRDGGTWKLRAAVFCLPWLLTLGLLALRSAAIEGDPRTPVMNPGTVFFEGNNPLSRGTSAVYPPSVDTLAAQSRDVPDSGHVHYREVARAAAGRRLTIVEVNAWWSARALAFLRDEPVHWGRRLAGKLLFAFHGFPWHDVPTAWRYDATLDVPGLPFALLSALALLGLLLAAPSWRAHLLEYLLVANQLGVMLVFYVSARQRLVLVPVLVVFAIVACRALLAAKMCALAHAAVAALLTWALAVPTDVMRDEEHLRAGILGADRWYELVQAKVPREPAAWYTEAAIAAMAGVPWGIDRIRPAFLSQEEGSIEERIRERLIARGSDDPSAAFDLAVYELQLGHAAAAAGRLELLAGRPAAFYRGARACSEPLFYLARARALLGEVDAAIEVLHQARSRAPGEPFVLAVFAVLTGEPGYEQLLLRYWGRVDTDWLLGRALLTHGRAREAAGRFAAIVERMPALRSARIHLAAALGTGGAIEEGVQEYFRALRYGVEPVILERPIVALFRVWHARHPDNPEVRLNTARVLSEYGHLSAALGLLEGLETTAVAARAKTEREEIARALAGPGG